MDTNNNEVIEVTKVEIAKLELKKGDILVFKFKDKFPISLNCAELQKIIPPDIYVILSGDDLDISKISFNRDGTAYYESIP